MRREKRDYIRINPFIFVIFICFSLVVSLVYVPLLSFYIIHFAPAMAQRINTYVSEAEILSYCALSKLSCTGVITFRKRTSLEAVGNKFHKLLHSFWWHFRSRNNASSVDINALIFFRCGTEFKCRWKYQHFNLSEIKWPRREDTDITEIWQAEVRCLYVTL